MTKSVLLVKQICLQGITDKQTIHYAVVVDMINLLSLARYACLYLLAQRLLFLPCCLKQRKFLMSKILTRSFRVNSCFSCLTMWICWVRVITKVAKMLWRVAIKRTINFDKTNGLTSSQKPQWQVCSSIHASFCIYLFCCLIYNFL